MKTIINLFSSIIIFILTSIVYSIPAGGSLHHNIGAWDLCVDENYGDIVLSHDKKQILNHSCARWGLNSNLSSFEKLKDISIESVPLKDNLGTGIKVIVLGKNDSTTILQNYYLYYDKDYILTDFTVNSRNGLELNYMAPIFMESPITMPEPTANNVLFVPYDNDAWVRYSVTPFGSVPPESYEVSALFNSNSREGIVIGSVEHDTWKTGIKIDSKNENSIDSLIVYGGAASTLTRDVRPHGALRGKTIKSPKILIGWFDDWRDGMETFADVCNILAPNLCVSMEKPFGWNSWGKLQTNINFDNASQTSSFFSEHLQPHSFADSESSVYVGLDSFWDFGFNESQRKEFADLCHTRGQKAGIYYCPFTDWAKDGEANVVEVLQHKYKDCYLYHNGEILNFDGAYALDPTHPAVKHRIKEQIEKFIEWGYDFVKIDFMAHGAYEADSHYDPSVMTGVQAYNHGMAFIDSIVNDKLWINLSIAPLFPANYAHSRRIGCDAWADIKNTEYTLNALTYGWWLDRIYHYNDADHIVMEGVTEGENRARFTSSAITGLFFLGDDLSDTAADETKERVKKIATNRDINDMARKCKSFRPVEHGIEDHAADMFYYTLDDTMYLAIFNFSESPVSKELKFTRLGLPESQEFAAEELWNHLPLNIHSGSQLDIPAKDVKVLRIDLKKRI